MLNAHLVDSWLKCLERVNRNVVDFRMIVCLFIFCTVFFIRPSSLSRFWFPICQHRDAFFRTCVSILFSCQSIHVGSICMPSSTICRICFVVSFCFVKSKNTGSAKRRKSICIFPLDYRGHKNEIKSFFATSSCNYHANGMRAIAKPCAGCVVLCCIS